MKTVGERIRQARNHRGWSGEQLAKAVGYKHQSGIANLEGRSNGRGGYKMVDIARALNYSLNWFLNGPDVDDMGLVPPFDTADLIGPASIAKPIETAPLVAHEPAPESPYGLRVVAHQLIDAIDDAGLVAIIETLRIVATANPKKLPDSPNSGVAPPSKAA